jgi:hypothetical protein
MLMVAFADSDGKSAGQQADGATENVKNQEGESHPRHLFGTCDRDSAVERGYEVCDRKVPGLVRRFRAKAPSLSCICP